MVIIKKRILDLRVLAAGKILSALTRHEEKAPVFLSYFSTVFFLEILYFMIMILLVYGRTVAVIFGLLTAFILTLHVTGLFFQKNRNRKIQLLLMDLHIAFTVGFLINRFFGDFSLSVPDQFMIVFRGLTLLVEIPLIVIFTNDSVVKKYS